MAHPSLCSPLLKHIEKIHHLTQDSARVAQIALLVGHFDVEQNKVGKVKQSLYRGVIDLTASVESDMKTSFLEPLCE